MTLLRSMRKAGTNRVFYLILTIMISIGLVGGYAAMTVSGPTSQVPAGAQETSQKDSGAKADDGGIAALQTNIRRYEQVVKTSPRNLEALIILGNNQYDLGTKYIEQNQQTDAIRELKGAVVSYGKALEIDPQDVAVRVDMATAAFYSGDNQVAKEQFVKAIEINPNFIAGRANYGVFLAQVMNDPVAAVQQWEAALAAKPTPDMETKIRGLIKEYKK